MRGYWVSQTAKFNKHWQSGGQGESPGRPWPSGNSFYSTEALIAPFYGLFLNGVFTPWIDVTKLSFQPTGYDVDICELQNVEVKPYIPRVSDGFYMWDDVDGQQRELHWYAHETEGCRVQIPRSYGGNETLFMIPPGTDMHTYQMKLLKPTYRVFILRRSFEGYGAYDLSELFSTVTGQARVKATGVFENRGPYSGSGLYGLWANENSGYDQWMSLLKRSFSLGTWGSNWAGMTENDVMTGGTPNMRAFSQSYFSGKQQISDFYTNYWDSYVVPRPSTGPGDANMPGFEYGYGNTYFSRPVMGNNINNVYQAWFVLQKLEVIDSTIVG